MKEKWKDIPNYEGLYQASNFGRIRNAKKKILKSYKRKDGYEKINLIKNKKKKTFYVHRIIAKTFLNEQKGKYDINHIDENKSNNSINNLEYCTNDYNNKYGTRGKRISKKLNKAVFQYDLNGNFIKKWKSQKEASKKLHIFNISSVISNRRKSAGGFLWRA